ncbi:ParB N-terminal domain-containing protein [Streptomyces sp. ACA25]|uniref:ParB/RepB/Spo0J family partition protein n=1 Tax=Streptomyces sp. ACA25 TaxID=3022596 RepID=UPI00230785BB|nr:ParB N-terminal domain-containing protein [Streptomyces sp. ACA25]MDB1090278.1 ParB N-terminal domain-containing protein [Streptomyces sp. ACA25]
MPKWPDAPLSEVQEVPIDLLAPADSPRNKGVDTRHARLLAASDAVLPPIVVHRGTMRIIDGMHRHQAAALRGERHVAVRYFEGSEQDAFVLAVRENTTHGLPLSAEERSAAAQRLLESHSQWSDRAIAAIAGVSTKTVRSLRRDTESARAVSRVGRDGRARPVSTADGRLRASELLEKDPEASLRTVAQKVGLSPSTVRDVRERLRRGKDVVPQRQRTHSTHRLGPPSASVSATPPGQPGGTVLNLTRDPSLRFTEDGRLLLRLLVMHQLPTQRREKLIASVPPHAATAVSAAARECARAWSAFADQLAASQGGVASGERRTTAP